MSAKAKPKTNNTRSFYEQFQTTSKFIKPEAKGSESSHPPSSSSSSSSSNHSSSSSAPKPADKKLPPALTGQKPKPVAEKPKPTPSGKKADAGSNYSFPTLRNALPSISDKRNVFSGAPAPATSSSSSSSSSSSGGKTAEEQEKILQQLMEEEEALEKEIVDLHELLKQSLDETDALVEQLRVSDEKLNKNKKLLKEVLDHAKRMISASGSEKSTLEKEFVSLYLRTSAKK